MYWSQTESSKWSLDSLSFYPRHPFRNASLQPAQTQPRLSSAAQWISQLASRAITHSSEPQIGNLKGELVPGDEMEFLSSDERTNLILDPPPGPARHVFRRPPGAAAGVAPASTGREGGRATGRACPRSPRSSKWPALVEGYIYVYIYIYTVEGWQWCCIGVEVGAIDRVGRGQGWGWDGGEWMACAATGPPVSAAEYATAAAAASCSLPSRSCLSTRGLR